MNPLPYLHGPPLGSARFKEQPEDFIVEEVLGFTPSGDGEHCLVWVEKRDLDSNDAATRLADALGVRRRLVSHCGLKDRHAITRQWFSIHLPGAESPDPATLESEGLKVLEVTRNLRKLRRGTHLGNRFTIRLRNPDFDPGDRWDKIAGRGVPNYFGTQRFGNGGRNVEKALAMFRGEFVVRDRLLRGILISAARSYLFNSVVAGRVETGNWDTVLEGEVFGIAENRSLILPDNLRGDERTRFEAGEIELTAPLWGDGELQSIATVRELETKLLAVNADITSGLAQFNLRQERRVMRVRPENSTFDEQDGDFVISFTLPKGTYATSVLREFAELA